MMLVCVVSIVNICRSDDNTNVSIIPHYVPTEVNVYPNIPKVVKIPFTVSSSDDPSDKDYRKNILSKEAAIGFKAITEKVNTTDIGNENNNSDDLNTVVSSIFDKNSLDQGILQITFTPNNNASVDTHYKVTINLSPPTDVSFSPLKFTVRVNKPKQVRFIGSIKTNVSVMDKKTANQAFGSKTADQFYVLDVVLSNRVVKLTGTDLKKTKETKPTLLIFSSSISLPVKLQCRYVGDKRHLPKHEKYGLEEARKWHDLSQKQIGLIKAPISNDVDEYGVPIEANQQGYYFCYRPYQTDIVQNTSDARSSKSFRERFFTALDTISNIGGFLSATHAITGSSDSFFNQFGNTFVPALGRIYPSKKQTYRDNIIHYGMNEFETIPYGQQLQRNLFIPSQQIEGVIPGYQVRITALYTNSLGIRAAAFDDTNVMSTASNQEEINN